MTLGLFVDRSENESSKYTWNDKEIRNFKDIIIKEKINCRMDDMFLLSFLRARKFDRERAVKLLRNYYSSREKNPSMFTDFNPLAVKEYLDMKMIGYLQQTDQEGRVIGIAKCPKWDPCKVHFKTIIKCKLMFHDILLNEHVMQVNGFVMILDAETLSWRHIIQMTPSTVHTVASLIFGCSQVRYKAIHVVNIGTFVQAFFTAFLPFLPYKIKKRIHFHSSGMESLHKFVDPKYLPADFGGELPPFDPTECNEKLLEFQEFFEEQEKYWSDRSSCNLS
ncbi:clavesin-1-like [Centruroides vittatus]|uniref:clavesin-1-like n=1 Tax=Centruroides vittatus TaxID=120091 RepID=UPI0035100415